MDTLVDGYLIALALFQALVMFIYTLTALGPGLRQMSPNDRPFALALMSVFGTLTLLYVVAAGGVLFGTKWAPILACGLNGVFAALQTTVIFVVGLPPNWVNISVIAASILGVVLVIAA